MSEPTIVEITSLAAGGDGVGRLADGRIVFVPWTAPGDRVEVMVKQALAQSPEMIAYLRNAAGE